MPPQASHAPRPPRRRIVVAVAVATVVASTGGAAGAADALVPVPPPAAAPPVGGPEPGAPDKPSGASPAVEIHGFASQGFMVTTGNDYLVPDSTSGSFQLSDVGLNLTMEIVEKLRFGVQAFAQSFGLGGDFNLKADWFYLDYRWGDWLGLRFGRLKIPFGLYNEVNDIDSARVPILLPQSAYPQQGRSFLFAQNGVELYGFARSRVAGALEYRLYVGTIFIDPGILVPAGAGVELQFNVRYVGGGRVFWETPLPGLRVGGSVLAIHLDVTAFAAGMVFPIENRSVLAMGSAEYAHDGLAITAEYARWHTEQDSTIPTSNLSFTNERAYAMLSYRATSWLQPAVYYALFFPDVSNRDGGDAFRQDDVALTLRFDVSAYWIVKLEGHYMSGAAGLVSPLSVAPPPADPERHWGVFLLKTTGYF
jgi:hypothetical protein